jgi:hypothetical protein
MKRFGLTFALCAALAVPATATAHRPDKPENPAKQCRDSRGEHGERGALRKALRSRRDEHGRCVSERAKLKRRLVAQAVRECKAERAEDPAAFEQKYGVVEEAREEDGEARPWKAFHRCVRQKVKQALAELHEDRHNAAKECKAERAEDPDAFREKYGTNRKKRNALGKCVAEHVRHGEDSEPGSEPKEQGHLPF